MSGLPRAVQPPEVILGGGSAPTVKPTAVTNDSPSVQSSDRGGFWTLLNALCEGNEAGLGGGVNIVGTDRGLTLAAGFLGVAGSVMRHWGLSWVCLVAMVYRSMCCLVETMHSLACLNSQLSASVFFYRSKSS